MSDNLPIAWIDFADNGDIRFWTSDPKRARSEKDRGRHLRMFTLAELVALAAKPQSATAQADASGSTDEEALAMTMGILEHIKAKALAGFKDEMNPDEALSDINNLAIDTLAALCKRAVGAADLAARPQIDAARNRSAKP